MEPEKQDTSDLLKLSFCKAMPKKFKKRFSPKCFIGLQKKNWIEIKPRIIYHKIQFASNRKKKTKTKKQAGVPSLPIPVIDSHSSRPPFTLQVQCSSILPWLGSSFLELVLNGTLLIRLSCSPRLN